MRSSLQTTLVQVNCSLWQKTRNIPVFLKQGFWCGQRETVLPRSPKSGHAQELSSTHYWAGGDTKAGQLLETQNSSGPWLCTETLSTFETSLEFHWCLTPSVFLPTITLRGHTYSQSLGSKLSQPPPLLSFTPSSFPPPNLLYIQCHQGLLPEDLN